MSYLETISEDVATGAVAAEYEKDRVRQGYVANYTRTFSLRPAVLAVWQQLNTAIKADMDLQRYELATLGAARRLRSSYCSLAHGKVLAEQFLDERTLHDVMVDPVTAGLDPIATEILRLADKIASGAADIERSDLDGLRDLGLTDVDIFDIVLAVAARCFFSTVLDATGTRPDAELAEVFQPATRAALTVGRGIAAG
jgi:uncharacterized peroxidase-related enzyme